MYSKNKIPEVKRKNNYKPPFNIQKNDDSNKENSSLLNNKTKNFRSQYCSYLNNLKKKSKFDNKTSCLNTTITNREIKFGNIKKETAWDKVCNDEPELAKYIEGNYEKMTGFTMTDFDSLPKMQEKLINDWRERYEFDFKNPENQDKEITNSTDENDDFNNYFNNKYYNWNN